MIRRMDDAPKLVNPSGWISEAAATRSQSQIPRTPPGSPAEEREPSVFFPGQQQVATPEVDAAAMRTLGAGAGETAVPPSPTHRVGWAHMQPFALPPVAEEGQFPKKTW